MSAKKKRILPTPLEDDEQRKLVSFLSIHGVLFVHVANERFGRRQVRNAWAYRESLRRLGIKPGFPDILVFSLPPDLKRQGVRGIAIELKRIDGRDASKKQKAWLADLEKENWKTRVCFGADEAIDWLLSLGYGVRA